MTSSPGARYGSDAILDWIAEAGIRHVALNPGATLRGLHDSLVRHEVVQPVLALHEEIAVGIAHGYAKASGRPMAVFLHDLVGLQHASMAIFNAWVDRVPMLLIGGSGPRAEEHRRPWLDWIHTGLPQGSLVRDFVKWDAEPANVESLPHVLNRAMRTALTEPVGPVYVSIDASLQEQIVADDLRLPATWSAPSALVPPPDVVSEVAGLVRAARAPVVVVDRPVRGLVPHLTWLAEHAGVAVVDLGGGCNYPTTSWADQTADRDRALAEADLVITVEVRDVGFAVGETDTRTRTVRRLTADDVPVVAIGVSELRQRGFLVAESMPTDVRFVVGEGAATLGLVRDSLGDPGVTDPSRRKVLADRHDQARRRAREAADTQEATTPVHPARLASAVADAVGDRRWQLANGLLQGWPRRLWDIRDEQAFLGRSGGEGLGYGLPASLGAALAHRDDDVLVLDLQADGDLLYTAGALWTAAHQQLPVLVVVHNNRTYGKDELHQTEIARTRGRSADVVPVGIHLTGPDVDFAALARAYGVEALGPVTDPGELPKALRHGIETVDEGRPFLVDVVCTT